MAIFSPPPSPPGRHPKFTLPSPQETKYRDMKVGITCTPLGTSPEKDEEEKKKEAAAEEECVLRKKELLLCLLASIPAFKLARRIREEREK
jgi:hypothetical protein